MTIKSMLLDKEHTVDGYTIKEERVYNERNSVITIWVAYENGLPVGNLRLIGTGPHADMEWRYVRRGERKAVRAPMSGGHNPVDACLKFLTKYKGDWL